MTSRQTGVFASIFDIIGTSRSYADFGFYSDGWLGATGPNTYQLHLAGWSVLLLDGEHSNAAINLHAHWLSPDSIAELFALDGVPPALDFLSVDIDSTDLWILRALLRGGYHPRFISVEYNSNFPLDSCLTRSGWDPRRRRRFLCTYGTSLRAIAALAAEHAYTLVYVEPLLDAYLVPTEILRLSGYGAPPMGAWLNRTRLAQQERVLPH